MELHKKDVIPEYLYNGFYHRNNVEQQYYAHVRTIVGTDDDAFEPSIHDELDYLWQPRD